jgi:uncharacterized protein YigE (DUF2233 family)
MKKSLLFIVFFLVGVIGLFSFYPDSKIISYVVNLEEQELQFFWKDDSGKFFKNHGNLKTWLNSQNIELVFAMNGGMYNKDFSPQGLYIEKGKELAKLDTLNKGYGNFYLQPNGVFYLSKNKKAGVCRTADFNNENVEYATQSGPMLLIDGKIHSALTEGSKNLHIRNGVGILRDGSILFAMSQERMNFYDFAAFFKKKECKNALYLDGFVSRTYLPSKNWKQKAGDLGVIIAEVKKGG